jgi:hypothetical protein
MICSWEGEAHLTMETAINTISRYIAGFLEFGFANIYLLSHETTALLAGQ